ncbi:hypothetical protein ABXJ76_07935 [Methylobacter sp. G7]|uniref:hypothetical protein n=1 Tax=Methylobacter sp. G7 TaxID=3230117 RepID=UPI003D80A392
MTTNLPEMKVTGVMHFANRPHLTYTLHDTQYISMRPLVDQISLDWRGQKRGLLEDDAVLFYGTLLLENGKILQAPCKYSPKNDVSANLGSEEGQKIAILCSDDAPKDTVFIRLRRVQMYIARISIGQVRSQGNMSSAEHLLALHEEWAEALYSYETTGIAVKSSHAKFESGKIKNFLSVSKEKRVTEDVGDRKVLHSLMKDIAEQIGHPYQADLVDE